MARRTRRQVIQDLASAGRAQSTAAVMFHTALAAKQGLSATETKGIELLERYGPLTAGDFGTRAGLAPASVTGLLDRLERKGFARRVKDPTDRRRVLVELDRSRLAQFAPHFVDFMTGMEKLYERFSLEELETILRFVREATEVQSGATARLTTTKLSSPT